MTMLSTVERKAVLDKMMEAWEVKTGDLASGGSPVVPFLELSVLDMHNAAANIDCPFCRRHMTLEAEEIDIILRRVQREGNRRHSHGFSERIRSLWTSVEIIANVLLGGLRRSGVL
jgi:hypothetical protein